MDDNNVAIYLDFENLAISAEQTYPSHEKPLFLRPILDYATSLGNICIKKIICGLVTGNSSSIREETSETWL